MRHRTGSFLVAALALTACTSDATSSSSSTTSTSSTTTTTATTTSTVPTTVAPTTTTAATTTLAPTTTVAPTTTTTLATTTTVAPTTTTTTTVPGTACPALPALPAGAIETGVEVIDADADGLADTVRSYASSSSPGAGDWHLRVELAAGGGSDVTVPFDPMPAGVTVIGGTYIGSTVDPGPEGQRPMVFATVGAGASASIVGLYRLSGCDLVEVQNASFATHAQFAVGASVMHSEGLRCEGVAGTSLLVYIETMFDDSTMEHDIVETAYTRDGNDLVVYGTPVSYSSPDLPSGGGLDTCGVTMP